MDKHVIQHTLTAGYEIAIVPLRYFAYQAIVANAFEAYPNPSEVAYRLPLPIETAVPGEMIPGTQNPDYHAAMKEASTRRNLHIEQQCVLAAVRVDNRQALIDHYADEIAQLRTALELPEDAWAATLLYGMISDVNEVSLIYKVARGEAPLTSQEVEDGVKYFRPAL